MTVKTFHLNCGTLRPWGFFPFSTIPLYGTGRWFGRGLGVVHCLLVDSGEGLILVDTGYGIGDVLNPTRFVGTFNRLIGFEGDPSQTALHQVQALGYAPEDVQHIFLTHMHLDHTGGLPDFPHASVHVHAREHAFAMKAKGLEGQFFIDQHWGHKPSWVLHHMKADDFFGMPCTPLIAIGEVQLCLIPTVGHTIGNCMVAVRLPTNRWLIHAGDTYGFHGQIHPQQPFAPPLQWIFRPLFELHHVSRSMFCYDRDLQRLSRELGDRLDIFCAHDPHEYQHYSGERLIA